MLLFVSIKVLLGLAFIVTGTALLCSAVENKWHEDLVPSAVVFALVWVVDWVFYN